MAPKLKTTTVAFRTLAVWALCWLAWVPAFCFAEEPASDDYPDAQLSDTHWRQRVEDARRRTEAFVAGARSRQTEAPARSAEDDAKAADERIMNDDSLQRGDIISTSKGLLVFMGRSDSERTPGDFQPAPDATQKPSNAGH